MSLLNTSFLKIAVIIATNDRCDLLANRALSSVKNQTLLPDFIIVCDDSSAEFRPVNKALVCALEIPNCKVMYQENARTNGASGCWNSAVDALFVHAQHPGNVLLAFLDDDDAWAPEYLASCVAAINQQGLDMVAAGLYRIESMVEKPLVSLAPEKLDAKAFLTCNPGIQGSNLCLRLSVFLQAGGFDEELQSTTDRDLCIRLADLGTVRYERLPEVLVYHYAESDRKRLSLRDSCAKLAGLTSFWLKYAGRMTDRERDAFTQRAAELFGWKTPQLESEQSGGRLSNNIMDLAPAHTPFNLVVGVISSELEVLAPLLASLADIRHISSLSSLSVLVLANGIIPSDLATLTESSRFSGLNISIFSEKQQEYHAALGWFGPEYSLRPKGQVGIAHARTMLQRYLGITLEQTSEAIGWILDDDMRVDDRAKAYLPWLPAFRKQGVDVLFGAYQGSSPNPPLNGLRVQLLDLVFNLRWLESLPPQSVLPDKSVENDALREKYPDYYYDLSRKHSGHLEAPLWLEPLSSQETVLEARGRLLTGALGILNGAPLTRSIVVKLPNNPLQQAQNSVNRGGCTFILNPAALTQTPNSITQIQNREARRSDMIWAIVNRYYRSMVIKAVGFPINHVGRITGRPQINAQKVQGEIVGSALYAGLTDFLKVHPQHQLDFSEREVMDICRMSMSHMELRLSLLERSFYRIAGLCNSLKGLNAASELSELIRYLEDEFNLAAFKSIRSEVQSLTSSDVQNFLFSLRSTADFYSIAANSIVAPKNFISSQLPSGFSVS